MLISNLFTNTFIGLANEYKQWKHGRVYVFICFLEAINKQSLACCWCLLKARWMNELVTKLFHSSLCADGHLGCQLGYGDKEVKLDSGPLIGSSSDGGGGN